MSKKRAFTLLEIMIVVLVIAVLLAVAIPNFITSRSRSRQRSCISNLRQLENSAKDQFAMETNLGEGAMVTSGDLAPSYVKQYPFCPEGGSYTLNPIGTPAACSENSGPYAHYLP